MSAKDKPLVWLRGEVKSPPFSRDARIEAGYLLRRLQRGEMLSMPESRSMNEIAKRCHELRISDGGVIFRIIYRLDADAVVIADILGKKTRRTPKHVIEDCRRRLRLYDKVVRGEED